MREIVGAENVEEMENLISFLKLEFLQIQNLQNLVRFCSGNCIIQVPSLKQLTIENCPKLKEFTVKSLNTDVATDITPLFNEQLEVHNLEMLKLSANINIDQIWHNRVPALSSFARNLTQFIVEGCDSLKYLLTSSMAKSLEHLQFLNVRNCKMMEGVIVTEGFSKEERMHKMSLPALQALRLVDLPNLTRFYSGNYIEFPHLTGLIISKCPVLKTFTSSPVIGDTAASTEKEENTSTPPLFDAKVAVPNLQILVINGMENLNNIWHSQLDAKSVFTLNLLSVTDCETLVSIFPFRMLEILQRLNGLHIARCDSLEEIFEPQGHIASNSQALVATHEFVFPKLTELRLQRLPKLKGFCHPIHITKFPSLKILEVNGFQQLDIFALELSNFQSRTSDDQLETQVQHPLFWINKATFSNLEELKLGRNDILKETWHRQCLGDYFPKLKVLELIHLPKQSVVPMSFSQPFPILEKLVVSYSSLDEIFQCEGLGGEERPVDALTQLSELRLSNLNELMHIWKDKSNRQPIVYNLRVLEVIECSKLINLVPSIISLRNLHTLEVSRCHGLKSLMGYSTAKSLGQLTRMNISDCNMIGEIVVSVDIEGNDAIVFSQLKYLRLYRLPKLATFSSVDCNFEFPSLGDITVKGCPKMQLFSKGELSTPKLQKVKWTEDDEGRWEGNLNTTLRQLFMEKVGYYVLENLTISESNFLDQAIIEIWTRNPGEILPFRRLRSLEVSNYSGWKNLLTPSMALGLVHLQDLKVSNCATMEHVITGDGVEVVFPKLNSINLESCSNLTCFYEGSSTLKLPTVKKITVTNCAAMVIFASESSKEQDNISPADGGGSEERHDISIQPFFSNKLEVLNLEFLKLSENINIQQIWYNQVLETSSGRNLIQCTVEGCDNLKYLLTSSVVTSLEHLKFLNVRNCKMMEGVIVTEGFPNEERMHKMLPKLDTLRLIGLPKLTRFYSGNFMEFPCLTGLLITQCPLMKAFTFSPDIGDVAVSTEKAKNTSTPPLFDEKVAVPNLQMLVIDGMENLNKIWHSQLDAKSFFTLNRLSVTDCETIATIFPYGMLEILQRLDELRIARCDSLEEIFEPQGPIASNSQAMVATHEFVFPKLTELLLKRLPKLKGFCHPIHITKFPSLKKLEVNGFQRPEIFALEFSSFQSTISDDQHETQVQHPLFWINKATFPNLEELKLERNDILKETWHRQCLGDYFPKLKVLELIHLPKQSVVPLSFLQPFPSLEKLVVSYSSLDEIFQCEGLGGEERPVDALTQLSELRLSNLNELMHVWKDKSNRQPIVYNLRVLEVIECSKLMNLVPSIISLRNLHTLEVSRCQGLKSLMGYSTAKSLGQLTRMNISDCDMIGEIVVSVDIEGNDAIVFSQLKYLRLCRLPKLATFSSVDCNFEFPSLGDITVMGCPKMQLFSKGELSTPKLQKVKWTEDDEGRWEGNLNTTLQRLFMEKGIHGSNED